MSVSASCMTILLCAAVLYHHGAGSSSLVSATIWLGRQGVGRAACGLKRSKLEPLSGVEPEILALQVPRLTTWPKRRFRNHRGPRSGS